jgi:hypothetical protein
MLELLLSVLQVSLGFVQPLLGLLKHLLLRHHHSVLHLDLPHQAPQLSLQLLDDAIGLGSQHEVVSRRYFTPTLNVFFLKGDVIRPKTKVHEWTRTCGFELDWLESMTMYFQTMTCITKSHDWKCK